MRRSRDILEVYVCKTWLSISNWYLFIQVKGTKWQAAGDRLENLSYSLSWGAQKNITAEPEKHTAGNQAAEHLVWLILHALYCMCRCISQSERKESWMVNFQGQKTPHTCTWWLWYFRVLSLEKWDTSSWTSRRVIKIVPGADSNWYHIKPGNTKDLLSTIWLSILFVRHPEHQLV